jgi:hypothetical protein
MTATAEMLYEDALQSRRILENWLPVLLKAGFTRKELERLDAGHIFMVATKITSRETPYPLTDAGERQHLIEKTRAQTL